MHSVVHLDTSRSWRGGQLQVFLLHRELIRLGVSSRLIAYQGGALHLRCLESGLQVDPVARMRPWNPLAVVATWRRTGAAEIVHAHDSHAATMAAILRAAGQRFSLVCHRRTAYAPRRSLKRRWKYRRVDRWIAVSSEIAEQMERAGAKGPKVVPSAVDVDDILRRDSNDAADRLCQELGIERRTPVVGLVGALVPQKGHDALIDAAPAILDVAPGTIFLCVGEGRLRRRLKGRVRRAGLERSFRFTGFRRDVEAVIELSALIVVPSSDGEGSNAVIKEAMVLGTPVVVSDLPGNLEVAGGSAVSFPVGDSCGLAEAVVALLARSERGKGCAAPEGSKAGGWLPQSMAAGVLAAYKGLGRWETVMAEAV